MTTADFLTDQKDMAEVNNGHAALFDANEADGLRNRWQQIQGSFVDEPQSAVKQADELVAATMKRLAEVFSEERSRLEGEWSKGQEVSTEDLRQVLRRYRSFFDRLLTI